MVIADVSGHSVGAALIMAETRSVLRAQARSDRSVGEILETLNELLHDDLSGAELFITMFYIRYDTRRRLLSYANAGHNPPLIFRNGQTACMELDAEGLILGVKRRVEFEEKQIELQPGDVVLLYTDGITEARNPDGEFFGSSRLCTLLSATSDRRSDEIIDVILAEVESFSGGTVIDDDISMVVLKILEG